MTTMKKTMLGLALALAGAAMTVGCEPEKPPAPVTPPPPQPTAADASALPQDLFLDKAPEGAVELAAAKKSVKPGDEIVVRGRIAGQEEPIADNRAILTLLDAAVTTCDELPGDTCPTPWDACCEPRDSLQASTATIQIVDASGRPLKTGLRGINGIEPLKELVVVGTVKDGSDANNLVINATGIHVKG